MVVEPLSNVMLSYGLPITFYSLTTVDKVITETDLFTINSFPAMETNQLDMENTRINFVFNILTLDVVANNIVKDMYFKFNTQNYLYRFQLDAQPIDDFDFSLLRVIYLSKEIL